METNTRKITSLKHDFIALLFYPEEDEPNYDGIHNGGIKGISQDAPKAAKEAYNEYVKRQRDTDIKV